MQATTSIRGAFIAVCCLLVHSRAMLASRSFADVIEFCKTACGAGRRRYPAGLSAASPLTARHLPCVPSAAPIARRAVTVRAQEGAMAPAAPAKKPDIGPKRGSFVRRWQAVPLGCSTELPPHLPPVLARTSPSS